MQELKRVKRGRASSLALIFNILAGMQSPTVAFLTLINLTQFLLASHLPVQSQTPQVNSLRFSLSIAHPGDR